MNKYERGDYVKVEFPGEGDVPAEWMWVRIDRCDEDHGLIFGTLDNEPVVNSPALRLGQELAVSYDKVREHRKPWEFRKN